MEEEVRISKYSALAGFGAAILFSVGAHAGSASLDFNNYSFAIDGSFPIAPVTSQTEAQFDLGYLRDNHHDGEHLDFGHLGILAGGEMGPQGARADIGARGFLADRGGSHKDGGGAAIGGDLSYRIPELNERLGVGGHLYYAPGVLTFGDFNHYLEYGVDVDYQVIRPAFIYVGWRRLELPTVGRRDSADDGFHAGIRVTF